MEHIKSMFGDLSYYMGMLPTKNSNYLVLCNTESHFGKIKYLLNLFFFVFVFLNKRKWLLWFQDFAAFSKKSIYFLKILMNKVDRY